ncbi:MAG: SDR family oxidoreductase [Pseudomonadales bacterium]|nr:MAG: SDR family oxidoreductase [Pseudomonadales bacterium]
MQLDMRGKIVLITGSTRGLGLAMAQGFAEAGASLVISSRKSDAVERVTAEFAAKGVQVIGQACNVSNWSEIETLYEAVYTHYGKIDVLINNAGMSPLYPDLNSVTEALFDKVIGVNLKGPFRLSTLVGERMVAQGSGSIINISTGGAVNPSPDFAVYGAAKAGLNNLTISMAKAFAPSVRVNCIQAGPFMTDIAKAWDIDETNEKLSHMQAMGRIGEPGEIVGAALYFASDQASYTTGAILNVDGGLH